jgi:glycosyltransferase involved in cell wall biosynthesis
MARLLGVEPGIHFEGTVPHEDMGRWLSGGDFFLLLSKWEGTSIALLEALAHGLYVVVTDIADHALLVNRETHGLVIRTACQTKEAASWIIRRHRAESEAGIVPRRLDATYLASRQVPRICDVLRQACEHIQDDEHER